MIEDEGELIRLAWMEATNMTETKSEVDKLKSDVRYWKQQYSCACMALKMFIEEYERSDDETITLDPSLVDLARFHVIASRRVWNEK